MLQYSLEFSSLCFDSILSTKLHLKLQSNNFYSCSAIFYWLGNTIFVDFACFRKRPCFYLCIWWTFLKRRWQTQISQRLKTETFRDKGPFKKYVLNFGVFLDTLLPRVSMCVIFQHPFLLKYMLNPRTPSPGFGLKSTFKWKFHI